jgi:hypothetical protein
MRLSNYYKLTVVLKSENCKCKHKIFSFKDRTDREPLICQPTLVRFFKEIEKLKFWLKNGNSELIKCVFIGKGLLINANNFRLFRSFVNLM